MQKCNLCGSEESSEVYNHGYLANTHRFKLSQCSGCGILTTTPEPDAETLRKAYSNSYYGGDSSKFGYWIEKWTRYAAATRVRQLLKRHGIKKDSSLRILDVGCGRGVLSAEFEKQGHTWVGVERIGSPFEGQKSTLCGTLDQLGLPPDSFDIIIEWHVMEHLLSPQKDLRTLKKLLRSDGSIFISVPNIGSWQAQLFKGKWFHLDLPRHIYHFEFKTLDHLVNNAQLKISSTSTRCIDQHLYGFLQSTLNCLPFIPDNHLYDLLKSGVSKYRTAKIICYFPLVIPISLIGIGEMIISTVINKGACLTVQLRNPDD